MSSEHNKIITSHTVLPVTGNIVDDIANPLAIIRFNQNWINFFARCEGTIQYLLFIMNLIESHQIDLRKKPELTLPEKNLNRLFLLWNGPCYFVRYPDPNNRLQYIEEKDILVFGKENLPQKDQDIEIIALPALDNMTPEEHKKDSTWGVLISQEVPFDIAFPTHSYETVINEGGFHRKSGFQTIPKFKPHELRSKTKETDRISRKTYNWMMKLMKNEWNTNWSKVDASLEGIIIWLKNGGPENDGFLLQQKNNQFVKVL